MRRTLVITAIATDNNGLHDNEAHANEAHAALEANGYRVHDIVVVPCEAGEPTTSHSYHHVRWFECGA